MLVCAIRDTAFYWMHAHGIHSHDQVNACVVWVNLPPQSSALSALYTQIDHINSATFPSCIFPRRAWVMEKEKPRKVELARNQVGKFDQTSPFCLWACLKPTRLVIFWPWFIPAHIIWIGFIVNSAKDKTGLITCRRKTAKHSGQRRSIVVTRC